MLKFREGDKIEVTLGKDRGREGKVERVFPKDETALVPELNVYKKHVKGQMRGQKSGIYEVPRPLPFSKFALVCPKCDKKTRVGFKEVDGEKRRICKKCEREIDTK